MKRRFIFMLAALFMLITSFAWGQAREEVVAYTLDGTITGGTNGYATESEITQNDMTWMVTGNTMISPWRIGGKNLSGENRPLYSTSAMSDNITKVVVTNGTATATVNSMTLYVSSSADFSNPTTVAGSFTASSTTTFERPAATDWANKYFKIVYNITAGSSNQYAQLLRVEFYKENGGQQSVATPTFLPAAGTYYEAQNVTIGCTTDGATIHYTLDGNNPTTSSAVYSAPIAISETTTVKAMAVKSGMNNSNIASATYTIQDAPTVITIAEAKTLAVNEYALVQGIVTLIDGRNVYVQDATAGICLYLNSGTVPSGLALGDLVQAYGKRANYNGLYELSNINGGDASQFSIISSGNELPLVEKTIAEINTDGAGSNLLQATRVKVVNATIGTINTNSNTPITQGENTINIYKVPALSGITTGDNVDVIGVIGFHNNPQLRVAYASDVTIHETPMLQVETPTFNPAGGDYTEAQTITIACATEDATVYYTLDGTNPTPNSDVYSEAFEIAETTTVKAYAVKEGMIDSEIAEATYTITIVPPTPTLTFNKIYSHTAVNDTDVYMIVDVAGGYAMSSANGTGSAPAAVAVTIENDAITGEIDATLQWNFTAVDGGYQISPINTTGTYLYTTNTNNGIRVGANDNNVWALDITDTTKPNYHGFKNVAYSRYIGVYNNSHWRSYTSIGTNIENTQIEIFVLGEAPVPPTPTNYNVSVAEGITNGTITVDPTSALAGATITVTADAASGYELATLTYTYGTTTSNINLETMQFVMPASDVTVNATFTELAHVATPTFSPAAGQYITAQEVTIACATEDATIYYTIDGTEPTTESEVYAEAFTVSATTTVKAMAVKEGLNNSDVASATYTIIEPMTIAAARALEQNEYALVQGVVIFIDGRNIYVQDETAGIDLFLNSNTVPTGLALGDMVMGYGKKTTYNGLVELTAINGSDANQFVIVSNGNDLPLAEKSIAEIMTDESGDKMLQSTRVKIVDAVIGEINNNNNTPITQGDYSMNIYKMPVVEGLEEGDIVTVIGVIGCYNNPQLRVNSSADVTYSHPAGVFVNPTALAGFNYVYDEGPSTVKTFNISARSLTAPTYIHASENYEISSFPGESFYPESLITINTYTGIYSYTIKVRLKAGLEEGVYNEELIIAQSEIDTIYLALSGSVTAAPVSSDYTRVSDLSQLSNGSKVIFAARFDENATDYYAMKAVASGKPEGVLFTSVVGENETLPTTLTDDEATYYWTVMTDGDNYTFTNISGDVLGYTSSTNFATGGDNTAWAIETGIADTAAMVPSYEGFLISNVNNPIRAFALNSNYNFGPYHTQNMSNAQAGNYNFILDIFATAGGGTLTCATPTFTPEAGTYYEAQTVEIACSTADATIYYTLDGSDPDENSAVYSEPIAVGSNMTIKAIAMKEDYENSNIATAEYIIILGATTIFTQDWEGDMNGWTFVTVEGIKPWTIASYSGNHYAYANGYNGGVNEQWCISPAFDLNVYSNATMTFRNAMNYNGPDMEVYFSNDYDGENPTEATWLELEYEKSTGSFAWAESGTIDLAEYTGESCYIGFKYISTENSAAAWEIDDITLMGFTSEPVLSVNPTNLDGFSYYEGNGPSTEMTLNISGVNLTENVTMTVSFDSFEMSLTSGEEFNAESVITLTPEEGVVEQTIYVRLAAGLSIGEYLETITVDSELDDIIVNLSGSVIEVPVPGEDWNRIYALSDLHDGDQIILASRYDANTVDGYYAMTAGVSGKPDGVLFTSVNEGGVEKLPAEISGDANTYLWNVIMDGDVITLVNAADDSLGYSSSTNFSGNVQIEWNIALETSGDNAMVPNYTGFVITNAETPNRGIAKNNQNKFGAYAISNMTSPDYNFYLDIFVQGGSVTPTVASPVFSMASGTYYEAIEVEIACATEGATIYYTTDGTDPDENSGVYTEPIMVEESMTIKAIAMMEGYDNSSIATANYVIITDVVVIMSQDWEGEMNDWTFMTIEGNKPWTIAEHNGNHYAYANGYNDTVNNEQWCISPAFNLNERAYQNVNLTFMNATKFNGPALEVYFSNDYDGNNPESATWEPLEYTASAGNYAWAESGDISLDSFSGENCYIAFRYISTIEDGAAAWEVDDIVITAQIGSSVITAEAALNVEVWNNHSELMIVNNGNESLNVAVYNLVGQPVLNETVTSGTSTIRHDLADGIYIVRIANGKEMTGIKVMIRR